MSIRKYPKGATHCIDPNNFYDERFYRLAESGDSLEIFAMSRHQWFPSNLPVDYLNTIHKLEDPDAVIK